MSCDHSEFKAEVVVTKWGDDGRYKVDVTVACAKCFKPLEFVGMGYGLLPEEPTRSMDHLEARLNAKLIS